MIIDIIRISWIIAKNKLGCECYIANQLKILTKYTLHREDAILHRHLIATIDVDITLALGEKSEY
ncbi:hypothetical protein AYY21_03565 [Photobacterium aquimaris]|uniref:Uncharacterized protein n=1 Tax=Photobacterium aquimaris TaxID=512643 RepID=A0A2T3HY30_9GAMM|nr:hypothetical protein AYY21_03565 [Photobacterium aquimaris]PSU04667.1 hypothetical protein C0W81_09630 [Photobacterium aquimaris]